MTAARGWPGTAVRPTPEDVIPSRPPTNCGTHRSSNLNVAKIFGLPILGAIILGLAFPYPAISLTPYAIVFLFVLMVTAGLSIDWSRSIALFSRLREVTAGLVFLFILFPLLFWIPARWLIDDHQYLYGLMFSALCPVALVAPYFCRTNGADDELAFLLVVASMVICPLVAPSMLALLFSTSASMTFEPLLRTMILLVTAPLVISVLVSRFLPDLRRAVLRNEALINMTSLSLLIFALFGTAAGKINIHYLGGAELGLLLLFVFLQDFGVLVASRPLVKPFVPAHSVDALSISLSMKNVAIAAGVLLVFDPRASFVPALAFVAHAVLFNVLAIPGFMRLVRGITPST
jgi:predicted Na+-dependent transporter